MASDVDRRDAVLGLVHRHDRLVACNATQRNTTRRDAHPPKKRNGGERHFYRGREIVCTCLRARAARGHELAPHFGGVEGVGGGGGACAVLGLRTCATADPTA